MSDMQKPNQTQLQELDDELSEDFLKHITGGTLPFPPRTLNNPPPPPPPKPPGT